MKAREIMKKYKLTTQDLYDLDFFGIVSPIEKGNTPFSWKYDLFPPEEILNVIMTNLKKELEQSQQNILLAKEIENEWSKTNKSIRGN